MGASTPAGADEAERGRNLSTRRADTVGMYLRIVGDRLVAFVPCHRCRRCIPVPAHSMLAICSFCGERLSTPATENDTVPD